MGQGYSMTTLSAASATIDVPELSDLVHEKTLASARFMKSIRARSSQGYVFVKAVMKPYATFDVRTYIRQITDERNVLEDIPNALAYQRIVEVGSAGFLVRQFVFSSVYDRLSTRPFLEDIEKRWLAYQLLSAVKDCHAQNLYHGDIKTENLLVTSWNWLYLTDFSSSFKPTHLPEDNPADFSFYFDNSSRRICYIAPERFTAGTLDDNYGELNWAMDMFSVGCVIAEIFIEGPIFTLSQIFKYRTGEYSPEHTHLNKIDDAEVKAMILNMIDLDPEKRYSAEQHLSFYKSKIFPEYFYSFLHDYMHDLTEPEATSKSSSLNADSLLASDTKIERVYNDYDKIAYFLGFEDHPSDDQHNIKHGRTDTNTIANLVSSDQYAQDGSLLFLTLVSAAVRNTARASARLKACDLFDAFARRLPDEAKLDRILPYVVGLLSDRSDNVKVAALQATTSILSSIRVVSPINAYLFPEYIFPKLKSVLNNSQIPPSAIVRAAFASCISDLALASSRMLDMVQAIRADGRLPAFTSDAWTSDSSFHSLYDAARLELIPYFEQTTTSLLSDEDTAVRRALLGSVAKLCIFFGSAKSNDIVLSHLNTYLNDKDWMLRCAFYEALVGVALYVGTSSLEQFILPMMMSSLTDSENFVVERVMRSLARMAGLGLFQKPMLLQLVSVTARFLVHPSLWLREAAAQFIEEACKSLSPADRHCIVSAILLPYVRAPLHDYTETKILDQLKAPLPKIVLESATTWATKKPKGLFWSGAIQDGVFALAGNDNAVNPAALGKHVGRHVSPAQLDREDKASFETLRNFGMTVNDDVKLLALREFILRQAQHRSGTSTYEGLNDLGDIISLAQINVTPQNIFFDPQQPFQAREPSVRPARPRLQNSRRLTDALLDASTTLNSSRSPSRPNGPDSSANPIDVKNPNKNTSDSNFSSLVGSSDTQTGITSTVKDPRQRLGSAIGGRHGLLDPSSRSSSRRGSGTLKSRPSAMNLLHKAETMKADAEISTNTEMVFGKLDVQTQKRAVTEPSKLTRDASSHDRAQSVSPDKQDASVPRFQAIHSYTGHDPAILRLLDHHVVDNFSVDLLEFGNHVVCVDDTLAVKTANSALQNPTMTTASAGSNGIQHNKDPWRPSGQLLTQLVEHTAPINCVRIASDHSFFVTASDDGSCKIWDTARLEKNVTCRSRYTHRHATGSKVKALCFVQDTHTFLSAATDGSIHAVRVELRAGDGQEGARYGRPSLVRDYQIHNRDELREKNSDSETDIEHATVLYHYREPSSRSVLLAATTKCRILMIDMKNMEVIHVMYNPVQHGIPTTVCVDKRHHWLMLGTTRGILDLWDLRFKLRLRAFGVGGAGTGQRVDSMVLHPSKGHGKSVLVSCGGEISVWDIDKQLCREVFRPCTFVQDSTKRSTKSYEKWDPDDKSSTEILERFATQTKLDDSLLEPYLQTSDDAERKSAPPTPTKTGLPTHAPRITSLCPFTDYLHNSTQSDRPSKAPLLLSVGEDRVIRYWDLAHVDASTIVSGPMLNVIGEDNRTKPRYESSWPTSMSLSGLVQLVEERLSQPGTGGGNDEAAAGGKAGARRRKDQQTPVRAAGGSQKAPRNTIVSQAQQQLLKTHMDEITDVALLRKPYGCIVSVDRGGGIYIFH